MDIVNFHSLLSYIKVKGDSNIIIEEYLSSILTFAPNFGCLQQQIDKLEKFVEIVDSNVDEVEKSLEKTELELNVADYSLKGLIQLTKTSLTSAPSMDTQEATSSTLSSNFSEYKPIELFKTSFYFDNGKYSD